MADEQRSGADAIPRRRFLAATAGQGVALAASLAALGEGEKTAAASPQTPATLPGTPPRSVSLPPFTAPTERQSGPPPAPFPPDQRVGFALVGLGRLTVEQLLPAFGACKMARPVALVSGDPAKARELARQHGISERGLYSYQTFDQIKNNPDVQVVYIVLPNSQHAEFTVRAAQAGKHVLCEKPMAKSVAECERMIEACGRAQRRLMIAYRIQYEPNNRFVQRLVREKTYGIVKLIEAHNGQNQGDPNQWRQKKALAGSGSLPDVGLYCLNTIRFLLGEEPAQVIGQTYSTPGDPRFREVEENCVWQMRFPSGVQAACTTGYGHHENRRYRVLAERAWFGLDPAFSYQGLRMELSSAEGPLERRQNPSLEPKNQFALEMDHMADCVRNNKRPYTPGEEGLQDHRIMAAIYESARTGRSVNLPAVSGLDSTRGPAPTNT